MTHEELLAALRATVGEAHCLTDAGLRASYETDWTRRFTGDGPRRRPPRIHGRGGDHPPSLRGGRHRGRPAGRQHRHGRWLGAARTARWSLSLLRLAAIGEVDADAGEVTVGAGATLASVQAAARATGWDVGVDLGARDSATIGGMVATNAGGVHVMRHGSMRRQLLGFEAVLADGTILRRLPGMPKDNTGYDLGGLLAGSEGTLAVITAVRLRLVPALAPPGSGHRRLRRCSRGRSCGRGHFAAGLHRSRPSSCSPMAAWSSSCATPGWLPRSRRADRSTCWRGRRRRSTGPTDDLVDALDALGLGDAAVIADDPAGRHRLWQLRERHTEAMNAEGSAAQDRRLRAPQSIRGAGRARPHGRRRGRCARTRRSCTATSATETPTSTSSGPAPDDESVDDAALGLALELGGSVSAEHGIGVAKVDWLRRDRGDAAVAAMRAIKAAWDPAGILNPGVLFRP